MNNRYIADFETTVYDGQENTEVWAAAIVEENTEDVVIVNSIEAFFNYVFSLPGDIDIYFHNLKFDGTFILNYALDKLGLVQSLIEIEDPDFPEMMSYEFSRDKDMVNNTIKYLISDMGQWYSITIKDKTGRFIRFKDSLKLIPLSVKTMGKAFDTQHRKLDIEYDCERHAGGEITDEERAYIINDVLVVKESMEYMWHEGHDKLTIGSCCLEEYKEVFEEWLDEINIPNWTYRNLFPDLRDFILDDGIRDPIYDAHNADEYIRRAYKGGWCYVNKYKAGQTIKDGITLDVNSLYPSVMHSESGSKYPYGKPHFWTGAIPEEVENNPDVYYYVRIRTRFYLKPGYLPFISIKNDAAYRGNEILETSDVYSHAAKKYCRYRTDPENGAIIPSTVVLTLTCTDWKLLKEHYDLEDLEILDGCWFYSMTGLFDRYIDKWAKVKMESTGGMRQIAKLFLNNLYGKLAASDRSDFKIARVDEDGVLKFSVWHANDKDPGYIPIGAAITSYAREFTIRAAQANYHTDLPGFIYSDTDSIHLDIPESELQGVPIDDVKFNHWKVESKWTRGKFVRAKTYMEEVDGEWDIKCAGMPKRCKNLFIEGMTGNPRPMEELTEDEESFLYSHGKPRQYSMEDFDIGLQVPGKLVPRQIPGGTLLVETLYTMKAR